MKKRIIPVLLGLIFIAILVFQFVMNFDFTSQPPSPQWSKEVLLSSGNINAYPKLLKINGNYIVAHDDGSKIVIIKADNLGKKITEKTYPAGNEPVNNLNLLYDGKNIYLNWIVNENNVNVLHNLELDKSFNIVRSWKNSGVNDDVQIGENVMVMSFGNTIEFKDFKDNKTIDANAPDASSESLLSGTSIDSKYLVTYYSNKEGKLKYLYFANNKASEIKSLGMIVLSSDQAFTGAAIASDGTNVYEIMEMRFRAEYGQAMYAQFALDGSNFKIGTLPFQNITTIYNPVSVSSSNEGARFLASGERPFGKKTEQDDIIDFTIKNGAMEKYSYVSRIGNFASMPAFYDNTALFCDFNSLNQSNLYIASQNKVFSRAANRVRISEVGKALGDTLQGMIMGIVYTFTIGLFIVIPAVILSGSLSIVGYNLNNRRRRQLFVGMYLLIVLDKIFVFYDVFYKLHGYLMPDVLSSDVTVITLNILISIVPFIRAYRKYKSRTESMAIAPFMLSIGLDLIFSQMLFVPFIS